MFREFRNPEMVGCLQTDIYIDFVSILQSSVRHWGWNHASTWTMIWTKWSRKSRQRRRHRVKRKKHLAAVARAGFLLEICRVCAASTVPVAPKNWSMQWASESCTGSELPEVAEMPPLLVVVLSSEEATNRCRWSADTLKTRLESIEWGLQI